jgi:NAD-dependent SIR2 family protein deacetylase
MNNESKISNLTASMASEIYASSYKNIETVQKSKTCGCFYCQKTFSSESILKWVDKGLTALCPYCETDAVVPNISDTQILFKMHMLYFKN